MTRESFLLIFVVSILFALGLIMVFNTTSAEMIEKSMYVNTYNLFIKQICYALIGISVGFFVWQMGYEKLFLMSPSLLLFSVILLCCVFVPKIGQEINGAKRWIGIMGYTFQPSEIAKFSILLYFIYRVVQKKSPLHFWEFFRVMSIVFVPIGLIILEPDNGTTAFIIAMLIVLFVITKIKWSYWAMPLACTVLIGGTVAYNVMPHVADRIRVYLHPETDLRGKGHQPYQAKIAAGSGKVWGKGLGQSFQKFNYLPEARSDYIAAIYAEEFGFVGICFLISLYLVFAYSGFSIAFAAKNRPSFYLAAIITFAIAFQAFLNLGVVSGLLPSKGMTLPFFSQGGTSLMMNIVAVFFLLNIAYVTKNTTYEIEI